MLAADLRPGLAARGARQRLIVRDPSKAPSVAGAEIRRASGYIAGEEMRAALEGAHTVFVIPARESAIRVAEHISAIDAAVAAGVERIVYLSVVGAAPDATFTLARDHYATEQHIRNAGIPYTLLRTAPVYGFQSVHGQLGWRDQGSCGQRPARRPAARRHR